MNEDIEPTIEIEKSSIGGTTERHPAYGQISGSRVSGQRYLYGSDFKHQHYVQITISRSSLSRSVSNDWPHSGEELIQVALSEAQWATFVSSLNVGMGVQCTINHIDRKLVPGIANNTDRPEQFKSEVEDRLNIARSALKDLSNKIQESNLSIKQKETLLSHVNTANMNIGSNIKFVSDQFGEHIEKTVEKAKIEVNAYIQQNLQHLGIDALTTADSPLLLDSPK